MGIVIPFPKSLERLMGLPWFRMYAEFASDPKVQSMDETLQRRFIMFLCLQCRGEYEQLSLEELAFALRIEPTELQRTIDAFKAKGLLDKEGKISNWNKRQYKSDSSTERVRKHRSGKSETVMKRFSNGGVTPPDTDTDTDTEENSVRAAAPPTLDAALFADARKVFGSSIGGQINRAIRDRGKSWLVDVLERCRGKDPEAARAYLAQAMRRPSRGHDRVVV